jgi:hypothetical protein
MAVAGTITSTFQGVLNVPMYALPYTMEYATASIAPGLSCNTGEAPILDTRNHTSPHSWQQIWSANGVTAPQGSLGVNATGMYVLSQDGYATINIGNYTGNAPTGTAVNAFPPAVVGGKLLIPNLTAQFGVLPVMDFTYLYGVMYTTLPAYVNSTSAFGPYANNFGGLTTANGSPTYFENDVTQVGPIGKSAVTVVNDADFENPIPIGVTFGSTSFFNMATISVVQIMTLGGSTLTATGGTSPMVGVFWENVWNIPDYVDGINYVWGTDLGLPYVMTAEWVYGIVGGNIGLASYGGLYAWQTDNATINTAINGSLANYYPCGNGFILGINAVDYYVSKDGKRYWQLNLISQVPPRFIGPSWTDSANSRWIDPYGTVWYSGNASYNSTTGLFQPLYSGALNIPYNPVYLQGIPPLSGPCWSPCLTRIGGVPGSLNPTT